MKRNKIYAIVLWLVALALIIAGCQDANAAGVGVYNATVCGPNAWVRVKQVTSEFTVHDGATACITSERKHLDYQITQTSTDHWQYPNISSGYEMGESSCASTADTCYRYPVRVKDDGAPVASVRAWLAPGIYNLSFDVWFAPDKTGMSYQTRTDDTELMIWLAHPGIYDSCDYHTDIDHIDWCVLDGWAGGGSGKPWKRITFEAPRTALGSVNVSKLWLNPFFRNAEAHAMLKADEWLYEIDLGNELYSGGLHDNIHYYSLTGVR